MKVKILAEKILENAQKEEDLLDQSIIESIYEIRRLKVALIYGNQIIDIEQSNNHNQIYINSLEIWINENEYQKIE